MNRQFNNSGDPIWLFVQNFLTLQLCRTVILNIPRLELVIVYLIQCSSLNSSSRWPTKFVLIIRFLIRIYLSWTFFLILNVTTSGQWKAQFSQHFENLNFITQDIKLWRPSPCTAVISSSYVAVRMKRNGYSHS